MNANKHVYYSTLYCASLINNNCPYLSKFSQSGAHYSRTTNRSDVSFLSRVQCLPSWEIAHTLTNMKTKRAKTPSRHYDECSVSNFIEKTIGKRKSLPRLVFARDLANYWRPRKCKIDKSFNGKCERLSIRGQ